MRARSLVFLCSTLVFFTIHLISVTARSCGHDGFYTGIGYEQMFMFTSERRLGTGNQNRVYFGPGFGANAIVGYDFCCSRWGIQLPFEFSRQKFNYLEWVDQFNISLEGVVHLKEWSNGVDIRLVGGAGWSYLTEGKFDNMTSSSGIIAHFGPGLAYYFSRTEKISAALVAELPIRVIHYFGDRLSGNGTTLAAIPLRISMQIGF